MSEPLYSITHLLAALGAEGYEATTKPTYLKYERLGVFMPGKHSITYHNRTQRLFTAEEIKENVDRYRKWLATHN